LVVTHTIPERLSYFKEEIIEKESINSEVLED